MECRMCKYFDLYTFSCWSFMNILNITGGCTASNDCKFVREHDECCENFEPIKGENMDKLYIISYRDYEDNYEQFPTFNFQLLFKKIEQYKQEQKAGYCIMIEVFEIDNKLIYANTYPDKVTANDIYDDCINMKDKYWDC